MKRIFILVAAIVALSSTTFAANGEYSLISKLNETQKVNAISNYLEASYEQKESLKEIFALSAKKMKSAMVDGKLSEAKAQKAISFNLANTKNILSPEQYKKYLVVLNMTLNNTKEGDYIAQK